MFIAAIMTGSALGYLAAGLALVIGLSFGMAFLTLVAVGMAGTLATLGLAMLHQAAPVQDQIAVA
jgi:hypothetical protein